MHGAQVGPGPLAGSAAVFLTEAGTLYFNQIRQVLESVDEVEAAIGNATLAPRGTLMLEVGAGQDGVVREHAPRVPVIVRAGDRPSLPGHVTPGW